MAIKILEEMLKEGNNKVEESVGGFI